MQTSDKIAADLVNSSAPADATNDMPAAKEGDKPMLTRSAMKSKRASEEAAAVAATAVTVPAEVELSDKPSNSSVKDFDPKTSPDASKKTPFDSDAKVTNATSDSVAVPDMPAPVEDETAKEMKSAEKEPAVEGSKKRSLGEITGGLEEDKGSKGSGKKLKLSEDPLASKKSAKAEEVDKENTAPSKEKPAAETVAEKTDEVQEVTLKVKDLNVAESAKKEEAVASKPKEEAPVDSQPNELQVMEAPLSQKAEPEVADAKTAPEVTEEKAAE